MRLAFLNDEIRNICENADYALSRIGAAMFEKLKLKIAALMSATSMSDIPNDDHRIIQNDPFELYQIGLANDLLLICKADHTRFFPKNYTGGVDWPSVNYLKIINIKLPDGKEF